MSTTFISLLFGGEKSIGGITIDAFLQEGHEQSAKLTAHPVEEGYAITDHVAQEPDRLQISGIAAGSPTNVIQAALSFFSDTPAEVYEKLSELKTGPLDENGQPTGPAPIDVVTGLKVYTNMIITRFSNQRNAENGGALEFDMELESLRVVKSQTVAIPATKIKPGAIPAAAKNAPMGQATTTPAPTGVVAEAKQMLGVK